MLNKFINPISSSFLVLLVFALGLTSCGGSKGKALDINNEAEIINFLQGKWEFDNTAKGVEYKIEIVGHTMKLYDRVAGSSWESTPTAERDFTLGMPTMDIDKYYHVRYLDFDEGDLPLSFRAVKPIWVVCDEKWGEPAIPYGGGFTYLSHGWKHEN